MEDEFLDLTDLNKYIPVKIDNKKIYLKTVDLINAIKEHFKSCQFPHTKEYLFPQE